MNRYKISAIINNRTAVWWLVPEQDTGFVLFFLDLSEYFVQ